MASTIQIKRGTGGSTPSSLAAGELAINTDNGSLYFGTTGGTSVSSSFTFTDITGSGLALTGLISSSNTGDHVFGGDIVLDNQVFFAGMTDGGLKRVMLGMNAANKVTLGAVDVAETFVQGTTIELSGSNALTMKGNLTFHSSMTASASGLSISGSNINCQNLDVNNNATFNDVVTIANNIKVQGASGTGGADKGLLQLQSDDTVVLGSDNNPTFVAGDVNITTRLLMSSSATDGNYHGDIVKFGLTAVTTVGRIYRWTGSTWTIAQADSAANAQGLLAVALGASSTNNGMLIRGFVTLDHYPGAAGAELYLSDSATQGLATSAAPTSDGDIVRKIGVSMHGSNGAIYFDPSPDFFEHA